MNKLLTKIVGVALGATMAVGVGLAAAKGVDSTMQRADAADVTTTYIFTDKSWKATSGGVSSNWTSGQAGAGFSNNGIQVTTAATGANGTSPISFTNVKTVTLTYNTNKSAGAGSFDVKVGSNAAKNVAWSYSGSADGRSANFTAVVDYSASLETGNVQVTVNTTTNSCYLVSCAIKTSTDAPTTYSVTYDANGATSGTVPVDSTQYDSGDTVTVLGNTGNLEQTGYSFNGWNTASNGSGTHYNAGSTFSIDDSTTLYAEWIINQYTLSYNANGGTGTLPEGGSYNYGTQVTVGSGDDLSNGDYAFGGWNTASDGSGDSYAPDSKITITGATTLYAQWLEPGATLIRVEDASTLNVGDSIAILASGTGTKAAMSTTQNNNNRGSIQVSVTEGYSFECIDGVQMITLGKSNGNWTFGVDGGYLYAASSSNNYLKTQSTNNANGEWVISISNGVATITAQGSNTHNVLKNNGSIFSCYTGGQTDVSIYKEAGSVVPADSVTVNTSSLSLAKESSGNISDILSATVYAEDGETLATNQHVTWSCEDASGVIAFNNENGTYRVTGAVNATTKIYATSVDGSIKSGNYASLTVTSPVMPYTLIPGTNGYSDSAETTDIEWVGNSLYNDAYYFGIHFNMTTGTYSGQYNENSKTWRMYQTEDTVLTITVPNGKTITSIVFTYSVDKGGVLLDSTSAQVASGDEWVPGSETRSATFSVGQTGSATNGQVQFARIAVSYAEATQPSVTIDALTSEIASGDEGTFTAVTAHATDALLSWSSSDEDVLYVDEATGEFLAGDPGKVTIEVYMICNEGEDTDSIEVIVNAGAITIAEANTICAGLESGASTEYKVTISGHIINFNPDSQTAGSERALTVADYKVDGSGNDIMVFGVRQVALREYAVLNGTVSYTGYLKNFSGTYELVSPELQSYTDDAIEFANFAYEYFDDVCSTTGLNGITQEDWEEVAEYYADNVDSYSKAKLQSATTPYEYSEDINNWLNRYSLIVAYGFNDFMGRNEGSNRINPMNTANSTVAIIVVATISVISVSALGAYFLLRKKKEER